MLPPCAARNWTFAFWKQMPRADLEKCFITGFHSKSETDLGVVVVKRIVIDLGMRQFFCLLFLSLLPFASLRAEIPDNFRTENLVAWCIVPFDAKKRGPAERSAMLERLGLRRCAYDWRKEHVPEFEEEILEYRKHGIEYFAFWSHHDDAFDLFKKHGLKPQIWKTLPSPKAANQERKVEAAAEAMMPLVQKTKAMGCRLGLYNHGGWGGEPANMIAVCEHLLSQGHDHVGIVYNFHHAHHAIDTFAEDLEKLKPYLLCLNLNGMLDPKKVDVTDRKNKIRPIGSGELEAQMIRAILEGGYDGPIGILGHIADRDVEEVLTGNLEGLKKVLNGLGTNESSPAERQRERKIRVGSSAVF